MFPQNKEYYDEKKETILEKNKQYYEANKKEINEHRKQPIMCKCGSEIQKNAKAQHERSHKHIKFVEAQKLQPI